MDEQIRLLVELQQLDGTISDIRRKKEDSPRCLAVLKEELDALRLDLEKNMKELEDLKKDRRTREGLLQMETDRMHKSEGRLKDIKTQKEYQALLKEIEQGKKLNSSREDDILKLISDVEEREKICSDKATVFNEREKEYLAEKAVLDEELGRVDAEYETIMNKWRDKAKGVNSQVLKTYQKVLERRSTNPVVCARDGACTGCHMNLPPQLYNTIQKGNELIHCPACYRILFWESKS